MRQINHPRHDHMFMVFILIVILQVVLCAFRRYLSQLMRQNQHLMSVRFDGPRFMGADMPCLGSNDSLKGFQEGVDDHRICFLIADVSGKGTPAALFMMTAKTMIKDYALTHDTTSEIFTAVNARLCENNKEGMFATAWIGIFDIQTMTLQYTNAGHNYPVLQRKGQPCEEMLTVHGLFLAGLDFTEYTHTEMKLEPGDRLLLYTDGVTEAHNKVNDLYGMERLEKVLEDTKDAPGEQVLSDVINDISIYAQDVPQFDDITMVVLTIKE